MKSIISIERLALVKRKSRLSTILQAEATRQGLRHRDVAEQTGIAQSTISRCLSGDMPISLENAEKIANALKLDQEWVVAIAFGEKELKELIEQYKNYPSIQSYLIGIQRKVGTV